MEDVQRKFLNNDKSVFLKFVLRDFLTTLKHFSFEAT
jgi:hypothetical protein